jgi:methylthioribose-1-phosphate isomerase
VEVGGKHYHSIWVSEGDDPHVKIIDQTLLPYKFEVAELHTLEDAIRAIFDMQVRGAPLIGATGAYGLYLALRVDASDKALISAYDRLLASRPTAVNLRWALDKLKTPLMEAPEENRVSLALQMASEICSADVDMCASMGEHGLRIIESIHVSKGGKEVVNILTHCNAGWIATVDWGTALAPIYKAHAAGIPVHVWVDETRPRNQGAYLTTWELDQQGVPHTLIVDNAGGHLMQKGLVDLCIVGTDRTTRSGDVCNKIGTYLKALAAFDNEVPFYVAAPSPSIDWTISDGLADIPIEQRSRDEVSQLNGITSTGAHETVRIVPDHIQIRNDAFDTTPAKFITGLITERGVCDATEAALAKLFPKLADTGAQTEN